jgi:hypothetical protein
MAEYLVKEHGFHAVNILDLFRKKILDGEYLDLLKETEEELKDG